MNRQANPVYISRPVQNGSELRAWAERGGLNHSLNPSTMHVTVLYSKTPIASEHIELDNRELTVRLQDTRPVQISNALGLPIDNQSLHARHNELLRLGATHDYADGHYRPHVTLKYDPSEDEVRSLISYTGFNGELRLGPEQIEPLRIGWRP